jgi:hypothetical protein
MMTEHQRLMALLKGPDWYAHESGKDLLAVLNQGKRKRYKSMNYTADKHLSTIMYLFDKEQSVRILKTWLSTYCLPLDPDRLKTFDQFHEQFGKFITNNAGLIKSY